MFAAVALFERKGIEATTVEEIAERADVAEKTFYNHFPTKGHLIAELAEAGVENLHVLLERARKHPGPTRERIAQFFRGVAEDIESWRRLSRELVPEVLRLEVGAVENRRRLHEAFGALLRDGLDRGEVAPDRDPDFIAEMAVAAYGAVVLNWVSLPGYPVRERLDAAARFLGDALGSPPLT